MLVTFTVCEVPVATNVYHTSLAVVLVQPISVAAGPSWVAPTKVPAVGTRWVDTINPRYRMHRSQEVWEAVRMLLQS